jgi:phosphate:Na+ symporter
MIQMKNPALAILVAAAFTGLVQSSSATTGVVIAMAGQGLITLDAGIALIFGANVGTCVTAMLASIGKPRNALRASLAHVLFNIMGVALWVWFIDPLSRAVVSLSPVAGNLTGVEKLAAETPRQIANAHTIFNVANTLIFLPFGGQFARLVEYLTPDRGEEAVVSRGVDEEWTKLHLDPDLLSVPSIALEQTRGEIVRRSRMVGEMIDEIVPAFIENDPDAGSRVLSREEESSYVGEQINEFLIQISRRNLHRSQSEFTMQLMDINTDLDHISSLMRKDLVPLLLKKSEDDVEFSEEGKAGLKEFHELVAGCYKKAVTAFEDHDATPARDVVRAKPELDRQQRSARMSHFSRIRDERAESVASDEIHISLVDYLRRIFSYSESIALTMLEGYMDTREKSRRDMREAYASSK